MALQLFAGGSEWRSLNLKKLCSLSMDNQFRRRELIHRLWAGTVVIAALCSHCATILMSIQPTPTPKAHWTDREIDSLLDCLEANKSEGDGSGNFKDSTFAKVVTAVAPFLSSGPQKTVKHCKTKWASVRHFFSLSLHTSLMKYSSLNQHSRLSMLITTTSRELTGITTRVQIFKVKQPLRFSISMFLRRYFFQVCPITDKFITNLVVV
jgi:hypothetical protein